MCWDGDSVFNLLRVPSIISYLQHQQVVWVPPNFAACGRRGCKNWPSPFPGRMSYKATKPGVVSVLYLNMRYMALLLIGAPFYVLLVFVAVFCLLIVLVKLSVLDKWLARKTSLTSLIVARGSSPESPGRRVRMIVLVYYIVSLFCCVFMLSPAPPWYIFSTFMARYKRFHACFKCSVWPLQAV